MGFPGCLPFQALVLEMPQGRAPAHAGVRPDAAGGSAAAADAALRRRAQEPGLVGPLGEAAELLGIWGDKKGGMNGKGISWGLLGI